MSYHKEWRPRLSLEIDSDMYKKLQKLIPWGVKNQLFRIIIADLIEALEQSGPMVLGAILSGKIRLIDILREKDKGGNKDVSN